MYEKELKQAAEIVKNSEKTFLKYFGTQTDVTIKEGNPRNLVSYADHKIEADIKKALLKAFPTYGFLGEETGETIGNSEFCWVLDPIDGTTNYLHGLPECCISLALQKNGKSVLGIVSAPALGRTYTATVDQPAKRNGKLITASKITTIDKAFGAISWVKSIPYAKKNLLAFIQKAHGLRVGGSAALVLCHIAESTYDFYITSKNLKIWDYAAAAFIAERAGGYFAITKKGIVAAGNRQLAQKVDDFTKQT